MAEQDDAPKIHVDSDWKAEAQAEKDAATREVGHWAERFVDQPAGWVKRRSLRRSTRGLGETAEETARRATTPPGDPWDG